MKILAVSDKVVDWIYSLNIRMLLSETDLAIGCGDLPYEYQDFIVSALNVPMLYVQGNHSIPKTKDMDHRFESQGCVSLHCKVIRYRGLTFAGVDGSLRYNNGEYQYSQFGMWLNVIKVVPSLLLNRIKFRHYLNVFVTHAPPLGIQDDTDLPHQGIKAFRWLISQFQPDYHLHGHVHVYRPDTVIESQLGRTKIINVYGYHTIEL